MHSSDDRDPSVRQGEEVPRHKRRPPLVPRERTLALPLSYGQERLWFLYQLGLAATAYNMPIAYRLEGDLNVAALERSIADLIGRHESLRTHFESDGGTPHQVIDPAGIYSLELRDLSALNEQERTQQAQRLISDAARSPFDLTRGPLFRTSLLKLRDREHVLLMTLHHIVSDGWSLGVLSKELGQLYDAYSQGRTPSLAALPVQPADHAIWQREWLKGSQLEELLSYWRGRLEGLTTLELPTDRPRPVVGTFKGAIVCFDIPAVLSTQLKALGRAHGATLYMVLLAGFQVLLARYSGQQDIVVGSPIAGRTQQELDGLIGFFVNTLVLRTDTSGDPTFPQVLQRVKTTALGAYTHQDLPFEKLVSELRPERHLAQQPLFQVMFGLQNFPWEPPELSGLKWTSVDIEHTSAIVDLGLHVSEEPHGGMSGVFEYATDLFDRITIERMAGHLLVLLESIVADPACSIKRMPILSDYELEQVTQRWNATQVAYPYERCVHDLFVEQVELRHEESAVVFGDRLLSYDELNRRANQLARHLRELGVGPDQVVGICVERGVEMIVGVLGILKAGGAYLPLDPSYPPERLRYMLEDAAPQVVLTQERLRNRLHTGKAQVVSLDAKASEIATLDDGNLAATELGLSACHLVFVIYTSGSTGQPKGTAMTHRAMLNLIEWHRSVFGSAAGVRVLQFAALSFDVSFHEIFSTLCTGGTLVLLDEWVRRDPQALTEFLRNQHIERLFIPPLMLQSVAEYCASTGEGPEELRDVIAAGEQLRITAELVALFKRLAGCRLHNDYGPTETHVVTSLTLSGDPEQWPRLPSIGRPIINTQVYVLDSELRPVPIGVRGEIYVGGVAVARGYLGKPELTAQRFLVDPFSADPEARLYKTGDLGRWRADGTIEFLGRNDDQVKIRGYRVELGEVEAHLGSYSKVKQVAVVSREVASGGKSLVAYVTPRGGSRPTPEDLRAYLMGVLPEYMVPSAFVVMEGLPLTPVGKLDRRALPAPELGAYLTRQYEAPIGNTEEVLGQIWQELLQVERIGRHDNFFELGGHSLLSVKMVARASEAFGLYVSVITVFRHPTIRELAEVVESLKLATARSPSPEVPEFEEGSI